MLDRVVILSPYFASILAWRINFPMDEETGRAIFERIVVFFGFFTIWNYLLKYALDLYRYRKIDNDPTQITIKQVRIWVLFILLLGAMELLRIRVDQDQFVFVLGLILIVAAGMSGRVHEKPVLALAGTTVGNVGIAYASFLIIGSGWAWQPALFALGVGLPSGVLTLLRWWAKKRTVVPPKMQRRYLRTLTTLAITAPVCLGLLALTRQISMVYMVVYVTLFWLSRFISDSKLDDPPISSLATQCSRIFAGLVGLLIVCRFWENIR